MEENFGAIEGICLEKNPLCHLCGIKHFVDIMNQKLHKNQIS
jgi:adenine-specific DNA glycosylase